MTLLAMPPQALWSLMQLGQFLTGVIAGMDIGTLEQDFWFYAGLMAVFTAIFCAITLTYQVCCVAPFTPRASCRRIDPNTCCACSTTTEPVWRAKPQWPKRIMSYWMTVRPAARRRPASQPRALCKLVERWQRSVIPCSQPPQQAQGTVCSWSCSAQQFDDVMMWISNA